MDDEAAWQAGNRVSFADMNSERSPNFNDPSFYSSKIKSPDDKSPEGNASISIEMQAVTLIDNL
jgi:hypothetical protein